MTESATLPWPKVPLKEVATDFFSGGTPSTGRPEFWSGGIPWTTSAQISGSYLYQGAKYISRLGLESSASGIVPKGNLLIGTRVGVGKAAVNGIEVAINQDLTAAIIRRDRYDPLFLAFALRTEELQSEFEARKRGATIKGIPREDLLAIQVPSPSPEEQRKIAGILRSIERLIELEESRMRAFVALKSATMAKLFREGLRGKPLKQTEIGDIPESWQVVRLGDIARIGNGSTPKRTNEIYWRDGCIPWITSTKIHDVIITRADEFVTENALRECHLPTVPRKSLVVAITGQGKTLGNVALLQIDTCINQHLAYVQFQIPAAYPEFYLFYLQSLYPYFRQVSSSGGSTKGALTCGFIANLKVPFPPSDEQEEIAELLLLLTRRHVVATRRSETFSRLFDAILPQLMTGTIRIKDLDLAEVSHA